MPVVAPLVVERVLPVVTRKTGNPVYDFDFGALFECSHPLQLPAGTRAVARLGAFHDYIEAYADYQAAGIDLIHSPEEHFRCSRLSQWYPLLADLTPRSTCYDHIPSAAEVETAFDWPVFVKGERQTSNHTASLAVARNRPEFDNLISRLCADPILHWQQIAVRELVKLRPVEGGVSGKIRPSFEFRTFWWNETLVGFGRYWVDVPRYAATEVEKQAAIRVAQDAASRIQAQFLVVDVAQADDGRWIVIECNDGQESGYADVSAIELWRRVIDAMKL